MNLSGISNFFRAGLGAISPLAVLGSVAFTVATSAAQSGAQELGRNSGSGFWPNTFQAALNKFSFGLSDWATSFMQNALGGSESSKDKKVT